MFDKTKLDKFKQEIKNIYPDFNFLKFGDEQSLGIMNNIIFVKNSSNETEYIIKVYRTDNIKKIISEHQVLELINKIVPESIKFIKNVNNKSFSYSKILNNYFGVYKYINGSSPLRHNIVPSDKEVNSIAHKLKDLHSKMFNIGNDCSFIMHRDMNNEFIINMEIIQKSIVLLNNKKLLTEKEKIIINVLSKKIKNISKEDIENIKTISLSKSGIIHGDFALPNITFYKNDINGILDWENTCIYNYVWEVFRSICYCSNENKFGIICPKLNMKKVEIFLKAYLNKNTLFNKKDVEALKLMPKYYYLLDPYIISSYCLQSNIKVLKLISQNLEDHFFLENHYKDFINLINRYAD